MNGDEDFTIEPTCLVCVDHRQPGERAVALVRAFQTARDGVEVKFSIGWTSEGEPGIAVHFDQDTHVLTCEEARIFASVMAEGKELFGQASVDTGLPLLGEMVLRACEIAERGIEASK
jgi:hypothetical protein